MIGIFLCCCSQPVDNFERVNEFDPGSIGYTPNGPDTIQVSFYSEEVLKIKWVDRSFTQQTYILERKINDSEFSVIEEFDIVDPKDSTVAFDTASVHGDYTYRVTGFYPGQSVQSSPSKSLVARNWLKVAPRRYESGDLIMLSDEKILAHSDNGGEIYTSKNLNWEKIDLSFCEKKVSVSKKLPDGNVSVICTSGELDEGELGVFIFDINKLKWGLAGKLSRHLENFNSFKPDIIPLAESKILVLGYSRWDNGYSIVAELFDLQTKSSESVDPNLDSLNVRIQYSYSKPTGIELTNNKVFVSVTLGKILIFNPFDKSWEFVSGPSYTNISDVELLKDGRVIVIDGTNSGFGGVAYDPETNSWEFATHSNTSGFANKLIKISNGNVFSVDSGGNVFLFETETDSWRRLENNAEPGFNFQYSSATVYKDNVIMVNNRHYNSSYIYRPSPDERHFFE